MREFRSRVSRGQRLTFLGVLTAAAVGIMVWALPATAHPAKHALGPTTVITVTMGQPTEFGFKLSKSSNIAVGKVTFKVTNKGKIGHSFKICSKAVTTTKANACAGTATKVLQPGQSAALTVTLAKGSFEYLCTVSGHAAGGMKGIIGVGGAAPKPGPTTTTTTAGGSTCASPKTTVINVGMVDFSFSGVPASVPCGTITFNETNNGVEDHNISIVGKAPGPVISAGGSASFSVTLGPGTYGYQCDVGNHAAQGMVGSLTVTP